MNGHGVYVYLRAGDLTFMSALGKTVLVLNTYEAANDLLGKRMAYMDRPQFVMAGELMGLNQVCFIST